MSANWPTVTLGDITTAQYGLSVATSDEGTTPILGMKHLQDGLVVFSGVSRVSLSTEEIEKYRVHPGDLLFNRTNSFDLVGKCSLVSLTPEPMVFASYLVRLKVDEKRACPAYVNYVLNAPASEKVLKDMATPGVSQFNINPTSLRKYFKLLLPSLAEQHAIVGVLKSWDRSIRQLTDLIAVKLQFKQGLMQQLLAGEKRLKGLKSSHNSGPTILDLDEGSLVSLEVEFGLTGNSYQEGIPAIGDCPAGWTRHAFRDVFEVVERPARMTASDTYQLVTAKRYRGGIVPREQLRGDQIKTKTQFFVSSGDFLISKRQIIHGACGLVPDSLDGALVSNEYACLRPSPVLDPGFLHYLAHTRYFQQTCFHASVGVALEKMIFRLDQWLKHHVNLPPFDEQWAIAHCLSAMDREILLLARQRRLLREQKKGLMQKLLTGQVRVGAVR